MGWQKCPATHEGQWVSCVRMLLSIAAADLGILYQTPNSTEQLAGGLLRAIHVTLICILHRKPLQRTLQNVVEA